MAKDTLTDAKEHMVKTIEATRRELASVRSGRASPGLVEHVRVDMHGVPTPINHMASVNVPEARLLTIQPWDRGMLGAIEKAIQKSDLGLNPSNDGNMIRLYTLATSPSTTSFDSPQYPLSGGSSAVP